MRVLDYRYCNILLLSNGRDTWRWESESLMLAFQCITDVLFASKHMTTPRRRLTTLQRTPIRQSQFLIYLSCERFCKMNGKNFPNASRASRSTNLSSCLITFTALSGLMV